MSTLTVTDCMSREIFAVAPETSLEVAARLFSGRHISGAPVVDEATRAVGVLTLNDLCDPDRARVRHQRRPRMSNSCCSMSFAVLTTCDDA